MIIVTAYYDIPSKASKKVYYEYIQLFFKKISTPVIFFTDTVNYLNFKKIANINVQFIIMPFENLEIFNDFSPDFWKNQIVLDPEKYHTWQLGALWANKSFFVRHASTLFKNEKWFIWVDAGSVRKDSWKLDMFTRRNRFVEPAVYLQLLNPIPKSTVFFKYPDVHIAGSHILFHVLFIDKYIDLYKTTLKLYDDSNKSLIMDQHVIATMTKNESFLNTIPYRGPMNTERWFFFFNFV